MGNDDSGNMRASVAADAAELLDRLEKLLTRSTMLSTEHRAVLEEAEELISAIDAALGKPEPVH